MTRRIVQIFQMQQARGDRVTRWLEAAGYELDQRFPFRGDPLPDPDGDHAAAVVYGGPQSANDTTPQIRDELAFIRSWTERDKPFLGLCLGAQLLAAAHGAPVGRRSDGLIEAGYTPVHPDAAGRDLLPEPIPFYQWHTEGFELPAGAERIATGERFPNQGFRLAPRIYGLQFHPETTVSIFSAWITEAGHMLELPGAQPREAHFQQALVNEDRVAGWLDGFMRCWLGDVPATSPVEQEDA